MSDSVLLKREITTLKQQQVETVAFLKSLSKEVGLYPGELIDKHLSKISNSTYNPKSWDVADRNGEQ